MSENREPSIKADRERLDGRYELFEEIAIGGMATVQLGRLLGAGGFNKPVAIKRVHRHLVGEREFIEMFLDEARLAARVRHPNVVPTLDVVQRGEEVCLVLEYVEGEAFSKLLRFSRKQGEKPAPELVCGVMVGALYGLHAAHDAKDENGDLLGVVHRDVSPQNIMVGVDGIARVLDFGVAKGAGRVQSTKDGQIKGKVRYMAPEQARGEEISARTDIYAAGVVFYEALTGRRIVDADNELAQLRQVLDNPAPAPSEVDEGLSIFDPIVAKALAKQPEERYQTARDMALAIEAAIRPLSNYEIGLWVSRVASEALKDRAEKMRRMEQCAVGEVTSITGTALGAGYSTSNTATMAAGVIDTPPPKVESKNRLVWIAAGTSLLCLLLVGAFVLQMNGSNELGAETSAPNAGVAQPGQLKVEPPNASAEASSAAKDDAPSDGTPTESPAGNSEGGDGAPALASSAPVPEAAPALAAQPQKNAGSKRTAAPAFGAVKAPAATPGVKEPAVAEKPAAAEKPAVDCSSPVWVDAKGIKRVKPECL